MQASGKASEQGIRHAVIINDNSSFNVLTMVFRRVYKGVYQQTKGNETMTSKAAFHKASEIAFDKAIEAGRLSTNPDDVNYAGHFMHMGGGAFKHIFTRKYLT